MAKFDPNKRALLKATGAGLMLAGAPALAKSKALPAAIVDRVIDSGWQFRQADTAEWLSATVPGTVHTDLLANKKIPDPFYRANERDLQWIDKKDWEYRTTFTVGPQVFAREHIELYFEGLDTYADVYVNDQPVLSADNMFREWVAEIKPALRPGVNSLRIRFRSPIVEGQKKLAAYGFNLPASNDQSEAGGVGNDKLSVFTRKAGYAFGWDWGPRFVTSGIWRPVHLRAWNTARIDNVQLIQDSVTADAAQVTAVVEIYSVEPGAGTATVILTCPSDPKITAQATVSLKPGVTTAKASFTIKNPKLWWTNGLGEAHLYPITARLSVGGKALDSRSVNLGVRTVRIAQKPDAISSVSGGTSFYVELNGVPVFMKGANYIPNDSFLPRVTHAVYDKVIGSAVQTHMNMIRVWGGGVYEDDYFYDLCDRSGILVWQDFMFACSMYPNEANFLDNVRQEAIQNVRRLRNHPCLAIWVGNNEIDSAWQNDVPNGGWGWKQGYDDGQKAKIWEAYDAIFHKILPETVAELDPQRFYWPSSPLAAWDGKSGVKHADHNATIQSGDIHYWDVWWGQKPFTEYRTHIGRFMSEYGFQSFPEFNTVKTYAEPGDYDIFSEVMKAHQRSSIGNGTIKTYMERDYRVPSDFRQFLYVGQVLQ
ncbi:MAG: glycoside hydrolase family 2 protein, partial [Asticcacaulis sp.]|nr:glycoside hydrolase family 2 protein [Asticcacaulis sp.]